MAGDGIEPPPAFSGLLTDTAKWFGIKASCCERLTYRTRLLGWFGTFWDGFGSRMFPYCSRGSAHSLQHVSIGASGGQWFPGIFKIKELCRLVGSSGRNGRLAIPIVKSPCHYPNATCSSTASYRRPVGHLPQMQVRS